MRLNFVFPLVMAAASFGATRAGVAGINLTGAVTEGTSSTGNYTSLYDWHTTSLPSGAFQLFVIQGSNLNGSFLNGPGQSQAAINVPLAIGANTFTVYADHNLPDVAYYGINLAFNGINIPVISGFAAVQTSTASLPPLSATPATSSIRWDDSVIASPGRLSFLSGDQLVTLTSFQYAAVGVYNADRVSQHQTGANGILDNVGQFTLTVSVVPEPSSMFLLGSGSAFVIVAISRGRRRWAPPGCTADGR